MRIRPRPTDANPKLLSQGYASTLKRAPTRPPLVLPQGAGEISGPRFDDTVFFASHDDLTRQCEGEPLGERIIVTGRVLDEDGDPLPNTLIELWQCNAAGRYHHAKDTHEAPLDPNFKGGGRMIADARGRYRFTTIKPGAYPWRNHPNAWRPAHIHFSVFGKSVLQRLITQMYFPGDPLLAYDPIFNSVPEKARERLVSRFDLEATKPEFALGYRFDIVLRGPGATPAN